MREWAVDLFSDTKTRPCPAMRAAMACAPVGDEQQGEDPTVRQLNRRVAELLGKDEAIFLPSGTMANLISILVHCGRGEEILAEASSHVLHLETGGPAGLAGVVVTPLQGHHGLFSVADLDHALRAPRRNAPRPRMVWIEQTTNLGGGAVWPLETLRDISGWAQARGLVVHIDGARLFNAAIAHNVEAAEYGRLADSLWVDFSKGLGAPFGAVLAGSSAFVDEAIRYKHMLGGAMRQAGIMAAACLYALDHNIASLGQDHVRARELAKGLGELPGIAIACDPETNIVLLDVAGSGKTAQDLANRLSEDGIRVGVFGPAALRLVSHRDLKPQDVGRTISCFATALTAAGR